MVTIAASASFKIRVPTGKEK